MLDVSLFCSSLKCLQNENQGVRGSSPICGKPCGYPRHIAGRIRRICGKPSSQDAEPSFPQSFPHLGRRIPSSIHRMSPCENGNCIKVSVGSPPIRNSPTTTAILENMKEMKKIFSRYNLAQAFGEQEILLLWEDVVGPNLARWSQATRFDEGTLVIEVASSSVSSELRLLEGQLVQRLNDLYGRPLVQHLRFVPGKKALPRDASNSISRLPSPEPEPQADDFAAMADVADPKLREGFARIRRGSINRDLTRLESGATRCPRCGIVFWGAGRVCPGCLYDGFEELQLRE